MESVAVRPQECPSLDQDTASAEPPPSSVPSGRLVLSIVTPLGSRRQCRSLWKAPLRFSNSRDMEMRTSKAAVSSRASKFFSARVHHMCQLGCDQPHSDVGGGSLHTQSVPTPLQNAYDVHEHCPVAVVPWLQSVLYHHWSACHSVGILGLLEIRSPSVLSGWMVLGVA